jgi:hypothetical protein
LSRSGGLLSFSLAPREFYFFFLHSIVSKLESLLIDAVFCRFRSVGLHLDFQRSAFMFIRRVSSSILSAQRKFVTMRRLSFLTLRKATMLSIAGSALFATAPAASAQVVNFHNANQNYAHSYGGAGYNILMYGQGAASDPGNNVWNGFGNYSGPNTVGVFYGAGNPNSGHGSVPNNLPGNPYAWWSGNTTSGPNLFSPTNTGQANVGNATSAGTHSPVTLGLTYGGDNGSQTGVTQGTPSQILSVAALTPNATTPGTFELSNVPAGTYNLFLYGANFDGTRGAAFALAAANGGTPLGGFTSSINPNNGTTTTGPLTSFVLGVDYVEFTGVTPDGSGNINGTWGAVSNPNSGLSGEGDFNGLQLQLVTPVPEPSSLAFCLVGGIGGLAQFLRRRRAKSAAC